MNVYMKLMTLQDQLNKIELNRIKTEDEVIKNLVHQKLIRDNFQQYHKSFEIAYGNMGNSQIHNLPRFKNKGML